MDYISNLVEPDKFMRMVSRLEENTSYEKLDSTKKEALLQRLASHRDQKPVLEGKTESVPRDTTTSNSGGGGSSQVVSSTTGSEGLGGVASEASGNRALEGLKESGIDLGVGTAVGVGAGMALGGLSLGESLAQAANPTNLVTGAISGVAESIYSGMGVGRDLGVMGKLGKGLFSMALSAVNPPLGLMASMVATPLADMAMDYADARGFEDAKDRMEGMMGELASRSGIDYASYNDLSDELDTPNATFSDIADAHRDRMEMMKASGTVSVEEMQEMEQTQQALDGGARIDNMESAKRDYSLAIGNPNPNVDTIQKAASKLQEFGIDPSKVGAYEELSGFDSVFGDGAYESATRSAKARTKALQNKQRASIMGITTDELAQMEALASEKGIKNMYGVDMAQAVAQKKAEEKIASSKYSNKSGLDIQDYFDSGNGTKQEVDAQLESFYGDLDKWTAAEDVKVAKAQAEQQTIDAANTAKLSAQEAWGRSHSNGSGNISTGYDSRGNTSWGGSSGYSNTRSDGSSSMGGNSSSGHSGGTTGSANSGGHDGNTSDNTGGH